MGFDRTIPDSILGSASVGESTGNHGSSAVRGGRTERIEGTIHRLKGIDLSQNQRADHLLVEAGRRRIFPWSKLGQVEKAWREPPHPDFDERTGWSLYNAFTEIAKSFSMRKEMLACDGTRRLILGENPELN